MSENHSVPNQHSEAQEGNKNESTINDSSERGSTSLPRIDVETQPDETHSNEPPIRELQPDAMSTDGVLQFLKQPSSSNSVRPRAMSSGSSDLLAAQQRQIQFQEAATKLTSSLDHVLSVIQEFILANNEVPLALPANLRILDVDLRVVGSGRVAAEQTAIPASLVDKRLIQVSSHAKKLQQRVADRVSRVLVTGDLNAGKSSLCNALLWRRVLPVDQQPCTAVFCEVFDAEKNNNIEEIHAVPLTVSHSVARNGDAEPKTPGVDSPAYCQSAPETYKKFSLEQLGDLVHQSDKYKLLVVYMRDPRPPSQSLLRNGVVDICLIDAPGLNVSSVTTTDLFGRQEEIDLVIFVVSAENQFTQSAQEFVAGAATEKSLLFFAVNRFDRISDQQRCRSRVLQQVGELAPESRKSSDSFVHFVSSDPDSGPNGDPNDGDDDGDARGLRALESSLRTFLLEKRSESKLAPAKTFLTNVAKDLLIVASHNEKQAASEQAAAEEQLHELAPDIDQQVQAYARVSERIERDTEKLVVHVRAQTEEYLDESVSRIGDDIGVEWTGLMGIFSYVQSTRRVLVDRVMKAVTDCEDEARTLTSSAVDTIKQLGLQHSRATATAFEAMRSASTLAPSSRAESSFSGHVDDTTMSVSSTGSMAPYKVFNKSAMFTRKKDDLSRHITADFGITDIFDLSALLEKPLPVLNSSKRSLVRAASAHASLGSAVGGAVTAVSLYQTMFGRASLNLAPSALGMVVNHPAGSWLTLRSLAVPTVVALLAALGAYVIYELPRTIPRRLARKIAYEIDELGYVRSNSERIAAECRKVLRIPAQDVRADLQSQLEAQTRQRDQFEQRRQRAENSRRTFNQLLRRVGDLQSEVVSIRV